IANESQTSAAVLSAARAYQSTAKRLEKTLAKFFREHERKTGKGGWTPAASLQKVGDVDILKSSADDMKDYITKLVSVFEPRENDSRLSRVRHGFGTLVRWTAPALKNFLTAAKDAQSVPKLM